MTRQILGHVMRPGHRCHNPFPHLTAADLRNGTRYNYRGWEVFYNDKHKMYYVRDRSQIEVFHSFTNFNCAAAGLAELAKGA